MFRPGGGKAAEGIRAGGGHRSGGKPDEGLGRFMAGKAYRRGGQARRGKVRHIVPLGEYQGKGAGPKGSAKFVQEGARFFVQGVQPDYTIQRGQFGNVDDKGIKAGPALGFKYPCQGMGIEGIRAQAVYRFRGKGNDLSVLEQLRGFADIRIGGT
jgi:hypothetical protein